MARRNRTRARTTGNTAAPRKATPATPDAIEDTAPVTKEPDAAPVSDTAEAPERVDKDDDVVAEVADGELDTDAVDVEASDEDVVGTDESVDELAGEDDDEPVDEPVDRDEPVDELVDGDDEDDEPDVDEPLGLGERTAATEEFWADAEVDVVEIALPRGVGYTLRHYRLVDPAEIEDDLDEDDHDDELDDDAARDEDDLDTDDDAKDDDDSDDEDEDEDEKDDKKAAAKKKPATSDDEKVEEAVFLATNGKLHMFRSIAGLIAFVKSDAPHDLTVVDDWDDVVDGITADKVVPDDDDEYELDLVVENLRGGHDAWDADLMIAAGEVARDIAFACGLNDVLAALAPGSPLDAMDEAFRSGGFFARRKLKKVGTEQAALAWRGVIGKIQSAVEWHD